MAVKSQAPGGPKIVGPSPEVPEAAREVTRAYPATPNELRPGTNETFEASVEELQAAYASSPQMVLRSLQDRLRRRLGLDPVSAGAAALFGLTGIGIRLALAVVATALAGQWTGVPWGRWAVIFLFYGLFDVGWTFMAPPADSPRQPVYMRAVEEWTALFRTIVRKSDLEDLAEFTRRLQRLPAVGLAGVTVVATMLAACWVFAPTGLQELPAGSLVLLALLLFDFGALPIWSNNVLNWATMAREARYDHRLFWPSPGDSPEVRSAFGRTVIQASVAGMWITFFLVLTTVLVSWDSPLVLPLASGFVVIGYLTTIGLAVSNRASVRTIVERSRNQRLTTLRNEIEAFESNFVHLSPQESEHLRDLMFLHDKIRDAPAAPLPRRAARVRGPLRGQ